MIAAIVDDAASLERAGYVLLPQSVAFARCAQLLRAIADLPAAHAHRNLLLHPAIAGFASSVDALQFITPVLGLGAFPVRAILFDKITGANWKVPWHQDLSIAVKMRHEVAGFGPWSVKENVPHVQPPLSILENMLTLRLHLDDCFADNGPLRILPGTHARGILAPDQIQHLRQTIPETAATLPAGGILLMRPLLLHASSPSENPRHRRVIHIEYAATSLPTPLEWHAA